MGRALMSKLLEIAQQDSSLEQILLSVGTTQEAAKKLYRACGFETYGIEPRAIDYDHMILRIR